MMNHENKRPVSLEDLLRLKRAERPSAEFWTQFDRELRAKQLAAIVAKRPWWAAVPRAFAGLSRFHLPLGATAVLALAIVSVREFRSVSPAPAQPVSLIAEVAVAGATLGSGFDSAASAFSGSSVAAQPLSAESGEAAESIPAVLVFDSERTGAQTGSAEISRAEGAVADVEAAASAPIWDRRLNRDNFAAFEKSAASFGRVAFGTLRGFEARNSTRARKTDPLAQVTVPTASRRPSLLTASFASAALPTVRSGERIASRITEERLNDTISRLNARGNSLDYKF